MAVLTGTRGLLTAVISIVPTPVPLTAATVWSKTGAVLTPAARFGMLSRLYPTHIFLYSSIAALVLLGLLLLTGCQRSSSDIVGLWELDREMAYAEMLKKMAQELGPPDDTMRAVARKGVDEDLVYYEFEANGSVTIRYHMGVASHGLEKGTWKQEGSRITISTRQEEGTQAGALQTRIYEVAADRLRWVDPRGRVWHLKRKTA